MDLFLWFLLLIVQNAAFTWVSRARNSGSIPYHALASIFSNGIFFVSNLFLITLVTYDHREPGELALFGVIYVIGTVTGSVLMHYASIRWLEAGKRRVGA
jgi:hypothetical protein